MVDGVSIAGRPAKERVLHDILGLRERAEHAVRDADQKLMKRLEIVGHGHRPGLDMPKRRDSRGPCDMAPGPAWTYPGEPVRVRAVLAQRENHRRCECTTNGCRRRLAP